MSGTVKLLTPSSGSITISAQDTASNLTATVPAATDTLVNLASSQSLSNKTITAANTNTVEATSGPTSTQLAGQRNKIINGAMMIDQRNAGASVTPASADYTLDRFQVFAAASSKYSVQQSTTAPTGFINSLKVTSLAATSVGATDNYAVTQKIEGLNCADLAWGTASAKTVTLSFWVQSSLTGTFGGCMLNSATSRAYPFSYTINAANTWEQKTVTVTGDTTGTWLTTSGIGIRLYFSLGTGTTYSGTAGTWTATEYYSATGATSVVGTNGATFYITGVQLEKGATATPFENRLYGTELALCQRYYQVLGCTLSDYGIAGRTSAAIWQFPVQMRASPTATNGAGSLATATETLTNTAYGVYVTGSTARLTATTTVSAEL